MIAKADELEEERVKSHERGEDSSNDIFDDTNALISISADLTSLGEIIDANMGAVRMFGYSRPDLIGANISIIMPAPYSQHHQS
jgi:PAS domain S-box-containing protein